MSEFLAEARILVRPDTTRFRAELQAELVAATKGITVPVSIAATASGAVGAVAATQALSKAQSTAAASTQALTGLAQVENTTFARQAVILQASTAATAELAGAQAILDASAKRSTASLLGAASASARLDAALLALRTAVGSTAVIGLGALALAGIVAGKALRESLTSFINFERELKTFRETASATAQDMEQVRAAAQRLGADVTLPAVSAADAAEAMTSLAKAGLSVEDSIAGATGVLQLATAAQISNADAAQLAANQLNAFGLAGDQAVRVADALANAANAAQGSITDFGLAFRQSSAVARQVGISLEDTTSLLALLARNGLQGSDAGTSLRVALIRLVAPTKQAQEEIRKLGLNIRDAQGNVRPDVFAQFGEATENLSPAARDAAAALIFGQDAIRAVSIAAREGRSGLRLMQFQIDQTGTAAELARARTEGLGGSFEALGSGAETAGIRFGRLLSLGLKPLVDFSADAIAAVNALTGGLEDLAVAALNVETPIGRLGDRILDVGLHFVPVVGQVREVRAGLRFLGVGVDESAEKIKTLQEQLEALEQARIQAEQGGQRGVADQLTKEITALRQEIQDLKAEGAGIDTGVTAPLQRALEQLEKARDVRIELGIDTTPLDKLIASLEKSIPITQHVEGNIQRLRDDYLSLAGSEREAASATDLLTQAMNAQRRESAQLQAELLRLQTEGGSRAQQIGVLQADIDAQRQIIADAKRRGGPGTATAITRAREQILRDQAQIDSLQAEIEGERKRSADEAARARKDADEALLETLGTRREDLANTAAVLARQGNIRAAIAAQDALQALIKTQIRKIRQQVKDEESRRAAIRALRIARNQSQREEELLRQQQAQERAERVNTIQQLNIDIAIETENDAAARRAIQKRIKTLNAQIAAAKGDQVKVKQLILERERLRNQLEELNKTEKDNSKTAERFFFEQLQAQQGFAANLLGNLIPRDQTAGLVGVPAPPSPGRQIQAEARAAAGRSQTGPTSGQVSATNDILLRILEQLKSLNNAASAPEAVYQKKMGAAAMSGGGGNVEAM